MPFKIVRNDITKMTTEAIVNTANEEPAVGPGCDSAVYKAAGYDELLAYRREHVGHVKEGDAFLTPGFRLPARYIIHAVSPRYVDGGHEEEALLRSCYRKSLALAAENGIRSIAFPLISTGSFGYPREEGMRIAIDEIHAFLLHADMQVYLVVFDEKATSMGRNLYPDLEAYIDRNYVREKRREEYGPWAESDRLSAERPFAGFDGSAAERRRAEREAPPAAGNREKMPSSQKPNLSGWLRRRFSKKDAAGEMESGAAEAPDREALFEASVGGEPDREALFEASIAREPEWSLEPPAAASMAPEWNREPQAAASGQPDEEMGRKLAERMSHLSDTFPQYLLYLIEQKGMENAEVYKRAIVDKKVFSKIKNNPDYHPQKMTALCLCIGAKLNLDESRDLLARAGYALSPCDKTDIIFRYFIENGIYDMIELDIQLEEHGLPCLVS